MHNAYAFVPTHRLVDDEGNTVDERLMHEGRFFDRYTWEHGGRALTLEEATEWGYKLEPIVGKRQRVG